MRTNLLWHRLSALSGVVASVLIIAGITVGDINSIISVSAGSDSIARAFVEHRNNILIGTYLTLLGVFFFFVFLAYLRGVLLDSAGGRSWLPSVAFGGGLVSCAMLLLAAHFSQAFTVVSSYRGETQVAKALYIPEWNSNLLVEAPALAALVGATTAVGFVFKAFPLWLNGWGALLTLVLLGPFLPGSGVMVTFMWLAVLSILLFVRTRKADAQ